jgi:hypothetical protein
VSSIELAYAREQLDGARLRVTINGQPVIAKLYDWQLVPIAQFAASPYESCFTLFGSLVDKAREREILAKGGRILGYHSAFANTLLGLRLMQLDAMLGEQGAIDLPRENGRYLLGGGEATPNLETNLRGAAAVSQYLRAAEQSSTARFRSYLICDRTRKVGFRVSGNALEISGDPFFYFWRYKSDEGRYDGTLTAALVARKIQRDIADARVKAGARFLERNWYVVEVLAELNRYEAEYAIYGGGTVTETLRLATSARGPALQRYSTESLARLLSQLRVDMDAKQVVYMEEYSKLLSSRIGDLRSMNPAVWEAGTSVMRYAALFRYCRQRNPINWQGFLETVEELSVVPQVRTPTVMM